MRTLFREFVLLIIVFSPTIGGLVFYHQLPDTMATHFGADNEVNDTMSKQMTILVFTIIGLVPILFPLMRRFEQRQIKDAKFILAIHVSRYCLALLLAIAGWSILTYNLGYSLDIRRIVFIAVGVLFLVIGNYLGIIKPNNVMGFRTPWALRDDENWRKTHRLGGPVMVIGGLIILVATFLPVCVSIFIFFGTMASVFFVPISYSFMMFKRKRH
ncbi:SdpI family protein [Brevibacillus choshinensis]|uniref:SdpI family protein n=1 Tax=Brevibacillus choshinensis TaxID=54911 RepID=UPI002E1C4C23|nr:SdpI family protein [Brevibacillus choshinensis]